MTAPAAKEWEIRMRSRLETKMSRAVISHDAKQRYKTMVESGLLDSTGKELLRKEMEFMVKNSEVNCLQLYAMTLLVEP